ncbi:MAG: hypothetical protein NTU41_11910, partial [Chloroflexi bacterium]|nr:hypothetical protein [Chloroflexota bacterium]
AGKGNLQRIYLFGINQSKLELAAKEARINVGIAADLKQAGLLLTCKSFYRRRPQKIRDAEAIGLPVYVLKTSSVGEIRRFIESASPSGRRPDLVDAALKEAEQAISEVMNGKDSVQLSPRSAYIRRLQHIMAERFSLTSRSLGKEPQRRVEILRGS